MLPIDGEAHYEVRVGRVPAASMDRNSQERLVVAANTFMRPRAPFDPEPLLERLRAALPAIPIVGATQLESYDDYYYGRGSDRPPLPVIRIRFADPMQTWIYVDPAASRIVYTTHRYSRLERWLFNGLHSLDFWYDRWALWDIGLIALMLGGLASSGIGLWLGIGRVAARSVASGQGWIRPFAFPPSHTKLGRVCAARSRAAERAVAIWSSVQREGAARRRERLAPPADKRRRSRPADGVISQDSGLAPNSALFT